MKCALYSWQCTNCPVHSWLCKYGCVYCTGAIIHTYLDTVYTSQMTVYILNCKLHSLLCTYWSLPSIVYSVNTEVYTSQLTVYLMQWSECLTAHTVRVPQFSSIVLTMCWSDKTDPPTCSSVWRLSGIQIYPSISYIPEKLCQLKVLKATLFLGI